MIQIHRPDLSKMAIDHYNNYFLKLGLDKELWNLYCNEINPIKKEFYGKIYDYKERILTGTPAELYKLIDELFSKHPAVMYALTSAGESLKEIKARQKKAKTRLNRIEKKKRNPRYSSDRASLKKEAKKIKTWIKIINNTLKIEEQFIALGLEIRKELTGNPDKSAGKGKAKDKSIFNYSKFRSYDRDGDPERYGGYTFVRNLGINVCPYCNRIFTHAYINQGVAKATPQFDHFFSKSSYPFLALSFYNLVPSCENCNSRLKGEKDFYKNPHIHPYEDGFGDYFRFKIKLIKSKSKEDYVSIWTRQSIDAFEIVLEKEIDPKSVPKDPNFFKMAERNIETFQLNGMYQYHRDYVAELLLKAKIYNKDEVQYLINSFPGLFKNREEVLRLLTSNYVALPDLEKRVLSKLTRDISRDLDWY
ncbi:hypothetical protein [Priestia aryabhattai]|uniref:hypothetical protein n=1 Tax=Priestia aryabhattai TaxID=412384 RepID=UPI0027E5A6FA|nr:hypothetical protein [Priestia aryabhattai]WJW97223.1 hypothetical protein P0182_14310 [Priestia aryabhattai]